jgi:beta-N-acetylhexosaminidase
MVLGPVMLDVTGPELSVEEREMLAHPAVGGVILFARNYESPGQIAALAADIHAVRRPQLLIGVDQEGGTVQRFRAGFTPLPPMSVFGELYDHEPARALQICEQCGWVMAAELRAVGVDFSFAPVLDLRAGVSRVVNERAFHADPEVIARLAAAFVRGMHGAGMAAVGKHFPGHGSVAADSHHEMPIDDRDYQDIRYRDMIPFERLIQRRLAAIMPAHVTYSCVDARPAGFSDVWLKRILRGELAFQGVIFSDDINMAGAAVAGGPPERARAALEAGCDMVLTCNDRGAVAAVLDALDEPREPTAQVRLMRMHGRPSPSWQQLERDDGWQRATAALIALDRAPELDLGDDQPV